MEERFLLHNRHLEDAGDFSRLDPQLALLSSQPYIYHPALLKELPTDEPGIYTIGGGRQIGKSTLLKQWMAMLLENNVEPTAIAFLSGEMIADYQALFRILQKQLESMPSDCLLYVIIDEVTYIKDWDKAIKYAADAGLLRKTELVLTGSDVVIMQAARMRFPGRRGQASKVDFHYYPLSFREVVLLKHKEIDENDYNLLFQEFNQYLQHGGFLTAINNVAKHGKILKATLNTYADWIRGDVLKNNKQEHYLIEILTAIIKRYNSQVSWNALSKDLSIDHPKTIIEYCELLASMDALFIQPALIEDKLVAAPKKSRKLVFRDPFIYHAINAWLKPTNDPYYELIEPTLADPEICSKLVEACVATHYSRYFPTFYIKAEGEVDIAYVDKNKFWPIEIKWTQQLRPKDLKQIKKYSNSKILGKTKQVDSVNGVQCQPLVLELFKL